VLVASFVALASLWTPAAAGAARAPPVRLPGWVEPLCGAIGVAVFGLSVYAGFAGTQIPTNNLIDTMVYVVFWVGFVAASTLLGDVFNAFKPVARDRTVLRVDRVLDHRRRGAGALPYRGGWAAGPRRWGSSPSPGWS